MFAPTQTGSDQRMTKSGSNSASGTSDYQGDASRVFADAALFEKTNIILPTLREVFARACNEHGFNPGKHKILDIGCGPFFIGLGICADGTRVDGYDPEPAMIDVARGVVEDSPAFSDKEKPILTTDMDELTVPYRMAMLNFVHQTCSTKNELSTLFNQVYDLVEDGGLLVVTGAHPDFLHDKHAACEYDVADSEKLKDGDVYTGRIYDALGKTKFNLTGDHFWTFETLQGVAKKEGFCVKTTSNIDDKPSLSRPASKTPPYFLMTFKKNGRHTAFVN